MNSASSDLNLSSLQLSSPDQHHIAHFWGQFLFTDKYQRSLDFVRYWGALSAVSFIGLNASFGLQVIKDVSTITEINFITMILTVCSTYFAIKSYGIEGGLVSLLFGEALLAAALWWCFGNRVVQERKQRAGESDKDFDFSDGLLREKSVPLVEGEP